MMYSPYVWQVSYRSRWVLPPVTARISHHFEKPAVGGPLICRRRRYCRVVENAVHVASSRTATPTRSGMPTEPDRALNLSENNAIESEAPRL